jgi:hypothetical protein
MEILIFAIVGGFLILFMSRIVNRWCFQQASYSNEIEQKMLYILENFKNLDSQDLFRKDDAFFWFKGDDNHSEGWFWIGNGSCWFCEVDPERISRDSGKRASPKTSKKLWNRIKQYPRTYKWSQAEEISERFILKHFGQDWIDLKKKIYGDK